MKDNKKNVYLIGYMGSGKSTVGKALSDLVNKSFVDMDGVIEREQNSTINTIFMKYGEHSFRNYEAELLDKIVDGSYEIDSDNGAVISCGGGIILDEENCKILEKELVVWLDADPKILFDRIKNSPNRPNAYLLINDDAQRMEMFTKQYEQRRHLYEKVADIIIDSSNDSVSYLAEEIANKLKG